jgi:hypothetical protein
MTGTAKAPPSWLIDGFGRVRKALDFASRSAVPPNVALFEMAQGAWLTQALYVAVKLGVPDALRDGPLTADEVAQRVGADPGATYRLMRALASIGVFTLRNLLSRAGFRLIRVIPTAGPMSFVEAIPASP